MSELRPRWLRELELWILDMDDTLYPEREFVFGGYRAVSERVVRDFGTAIESALKRRFLAGERGDLFTPALRDCGVEAGEDYVRTLVEVYRSHEPSLKPYDDVLPLLSALRAGARKLALVSDGWEAVQRRKWQALGLQAYFDFVLFTDSLGGRSTWKPSPAGFERCLTVLGVAPAKAVYVADNPAKDFHAPRALGMRTVRVIRPEGEHEKKVAHDSSGEAELSVRSLGELRL